MDKEKELIHFGFNVKSIVEESECLVDGNTENSDDRQDSYIARHVLELLPHGLLGRELDKEITKSLLNQLCDISNLLSDFEPDKEGSAAYLLTQYAEHLTKVSEYVNGLYSELEEQLNK